MILALIKGGLLNLITQAPNNQLDVMVASKMAQNPKIVCSISKIHRIKFQCILDLKFESFKI